MSVFILNNYLKHYFLGPREYYRIFKSFISRLYEGGVIILKSTYRVVFIDTGRRTKWLEEYKLDEVLGPVELGVKLHLEKLESWRKPVYHSDNALVLGTGILAGTKLYGVHRFIAVFRSPLTQGLHVSAMGGAGFQFNVNADALVFIGYSNEPLFIKVYDEGGGEPIVEFYEVKLDKLIGIWREYRGHRGIYALQEYLLDEFRDFYMKYPSRSILTGPGSLYTNTGALASLTILKGMVDYGSEDYAARAGGGSVLLRAHGVAAVIYGGLYDRSKNQPRDLTDISLLNKLYLELMGKPYVQLVIETGSKYRYDPKLSTGGTLGGNYPHLGVTTPMLHWNMIYLEKDARRRLHDLIMKYMWEKFNVEAIATKTWKTCGEPCPLACKKIRKEKYKSDYEPYNGLGPFIGIFDIHDAERVVELADAYGLDAIELGHIIGFLFEAVYRGLLRPEEIGISGVPQLDHGKINLESSAWNSKLAVELVEKLAFPVNPLLRLVAERGVRDAAKILDVLYSDRVASRGVKFSDLPIYAVYGDRGHISPNYYWTPGLIAPLYILGKYWTLYSGVFMEPEDYAVKSLERAFYELMIENMAMCRFHRGWAEKTIPLILERYYGVRNMLERAKKTYKLIAKYQELAGASPKIWDSKRIVEFMAKAAEEYGDNKWSELFKKDMYAAAEEWWTRFYRKVQEILGAE
jgi:glyceraldehyde-3-phosphate dehydrogenase (ferredoxin)